MDPLVYRSPGSASGDFRCLSRTKLNCHITSLGGFSISHYGTRADGYCEYEHCMTRRIQVRNHSHQPICLN